MVTTRRHGKVFELVIVSGPYYTGRPPVWAAGCDVHNWQSPESSGEDCRVLGTARSRYITLNAPMGYAQYRDVPVEIATQFDRILDSLCWQEWKKVHPAAGESR
jgi:hypothetical protein